DLRAGRDHRCRHLLATKALLSRRCRRVELRLLAQGTAGWGEAVPLVSPSFAVLAVIHRSQADGLLDGVVEDLTHDWASGRSTVLEATYDGHRGSAEGERGYI